jgi:hypothetical protein
LAIGACQQFGLHKANVTAASCDPRLFQIVSALCSIGTGKDHNRLLQRLSSLGLPTRVEMQKGQAHQHAIDQSPSTLGSIRPDICCGGQYGCRSTKEQSMSYARFAAMIATSTIIMFGLMYLNSYALDHVTFSQTRAWMALLMGAAMATIMMAFMWSMYKEKTVNASIVFGSVVVFALSLWLVRSQETVDDVSYMSAMIPHHSIAIMTSERAHIRDPRVRKLADEIIKAQVREIGEMEALIADLGANPLPNSAEDLPPMSATEKPAAP